MLSGRQTLDRIRRLLVSRARIVGYWIRWLGIENGTRLCEDAAFDLEIISKGIPDEIHRVVMPRFEINVVDIAASCPIDDTADAGP